MTIKNGLMNGLILPDHLLDKGRDLGVMEAERHDLLVAIQRVLAAMSSTQVHAGTQNFRNGLGVVMPGSRSVGEAVGGAIACGASLVGVFLDQMGAADESQREGHIRACTQAFEAVLRSRQNAAAQARMIQAAEAAAKAQEEK